MGVTSLENRPAPPELPKKMPELELVETSWRTFGYTSDYIYKMSSIKEGTVFWVCRNHPKCPAGLWTQDDREPTLEILGSTEAHNHSANPNAIEALKILSRYSLMAIEETDRSISDVIKSFEEEANKLKLEVRLQLPSIAEMKFNLQSRRELYVPTNEDPKKLFM